MKVETQRQIGSCNRCGSCLAACPVYSVELREANSPRGKMALARHLVAGDVTFTPRMREILSECLLCGSCLSVCPSGVQGSHVFSELRRESLHSAGLDWRKQLMTRLLAHPGPLEETARFARLARPLMESLVPGSLLSGPLDTAALPDFSSPFFRYRVPQVVHPQGKPRGRVAYFYGCATDFLFAEVGEAVVRSLVSAGFEVHVPRGQMCCGVPILMSGDYAASVGNISRNVSLLTSNRYDAVVVDCATCGSTLRNEYPRVLDALGQNGDRALELSMKVRDVTQLLAEAPRGSRRSNDHVTVTYHDPCHLLKGQKVKEEPRRFLQRLPGVDFVEMSQPDGCCGGGGTFQFDHPDISNRILERKVGSILATSADVVATGCPSCRITLRRGLKGSRIRVVHPVELI